MVCVCVEIEGTRKKRKYAKTNNRLDSETDRQVKKKKKKNHKKQTYNLRARTRKKKCLGGKKVRRKSESWSD